MMEMGTLSWRSNWLDTPTPAVIYYQKWYRYLLYNTWQLHNNGVNALKKNHETFRS